MPSGLGKRERGAVHLEELLVEGKDGEDEVCERRDDRQKEHHPPQRFHRSTPIMARPSPAT